jgi:hypothetical protein
MQAESLQYPSRRSFAAFLVVLVLVATHAAAQSDPLLDSAGPRRWLADLLPEPGEELDLPEYYGPADRARAYLAAGRYKRAIYELSGADVEDQERAMLLAEANWRLGRLDEAEAVLAGVEEGARGLLAAQIALSRGDLAEAGRLLDQQIAHAPGLLSARLLRGRLAEQAGDLDTAIASYRWFVDQGYLQEWASDPDDRRFESAEDVTAIAAALDRFATLTGEYRGDPTLHDAILGMFVRAYDLIDRSYWPARLAAAHFAYERSDRAMAGGELEAVLTANPRSPEALILLGRVSLDQYDFARAQAAATAIRAIDPKAREADVLDARNLLLQRQPLKARPFVDRLLARQPGDLEALGLLAAIHAVRLEEDELAATLGKVEALDPDNATAYFDVGEQLSNLRQYPRAEEMLRVAVERAPWWTRPRNTLGLLLTQSGDEAGAIAELTEARKHDNFNAQTSNYLALLTELADYDQLPTEHFLIQFDQELDPISAELFAEYLDEMKEDVARIYRWSPQEKTRIQIFPTHDRFSVRVAGDPFVGTVGACTGPVIAMVTPRDHRETLGAYDWAQVIRHEFTHTITLGRTSNRIPHWMTEGLAVREEQAPIRQEWLDLLAAAYNEQMLFPVGELTWGFVRPRRPSDRSLAYAQSWLVCEYIIERYGDEKLHAMLDAFSTGKQEAEVFRDVLGVELSEFDKGFHERMTQHMTQWGRLPEQAEPYESAIAAGTAALEAKELPRAVEAFERARQARPMDDLPMRRLAGLYLAAETLNGAKALEMLLALHARTDRDNRFAKRAARLLLSQDDAARAQELAYNAVQINPYDRAAHELLKECAAAAGDDETVAKQERRLAMLAQNANR